MLSLVPSLSPNILIPFTIYFSFVYLSFDKNKTPPDWQNWDPSGLAEIGPFRICRIGPLRIGKIETPPDWQNFGTLPDWYK